TIFAKAVSEGTAYDDQLEKLAASGADVDAAVLELTTDDVRTACDVFRDTFEATDGKDGRVSIEVDPRLAHDTEATIAEARKLWNTVNRPNLFVKIPATKEGLPAIAAATAAGISVNVTLIFSLDRYRAVTQAYLDGLERAQQAGVDLTTIRSVASIFLSRIDAKVDDSLAEIGTDEAMGLRGRSAIAGARLCYEVFEEVFETPRFAAPAAAPVRRHGYEVPGLPGRHVCGRAGGGRCAQHHAPQDARGGGGPLPRDRRGHGARHLRTVQEGPGRRRTCGCAL